MAFSGEWQRIWKGTDGSITERMAIPYGWLVKHVEAPSGDTSAAVYTCALAVVPDPDGVWDLPRSAQPEVENAP